jgi:hypothetical protein
VPLADVLVSWDKFGTIAKQRRAKDLHLSQSGVDIDTGATYAYTLCGWHTRSDIPLTNVPTSCDGKSIDIVIQIAPGHSPIAKTDGLTFFEHSADCSFIGIENVADFEVSGGRQIRVWPVASATRKDVEIFLCGPVWAALCHQRGLLPLHASAIVSSGAITAFAGHRGAGKSTTAALMASLGYELVTDDILPIGFNQNSVPGAWPYLRRLKLRSDSINELALTLTEPVSETLDKDKYFVVPKRVADDKWGRLERVYLLDSNSTASNVSIERVTGAEAVRTLIDQTYHFQFILGSCRLRDHLALCAHLASKVAIYRLRRSSCAGIELGSYIRAHLEDLPT